MHLEVEDDARGDTGGLAAQLQLVDGGALAGGDVPAADGAIIAPGVEVIAEDVEFVDAVVGLLLVDPDAEGEDEAAVPAVDGEAIAGLCVEASSGVIISPCEDVCRFEQFTSFL